MGNFSTIERISRLIAALLVLTPQISLAQVETAEALSPQNGSQMRAPIYTVVSCNDGDTCRLKGADAVEIKVRLVGIDAPENSKKRRKKTTEGQPGGEEAKIFLNSLVVGKSVTLKNYGSDGYGRNLAEIMIGNQNANLAMVSEGWAEVYRGKAPRELNIDNYQKAQAEAQKAKKGIWKFSSYESPKDWRKRNKSN
jgi:micrococcal nuclease